ncbi:MAG: type II toxin-antitoxin system RelE/ParE family toxin [Opitutaceae bacterium]|nr:type II toxin-antitoxin system RelE/ParE family toxin [Opitutaceae bacterium]
MGFALKWTKRASAQLDEIERYIAADNPAAAQRQVAEIIDRAEILTRYPKLGPVYLHAPEIEYRQLVVGKYLVFYIIKPAFEQIDIVTVWHGARGDPELP